MWTTAYIRRHIFTLPATKPFTTRDCLVYGVRAAVDQALYRLVKNGTIRRLARGIFVRDEKKYFSVFEIAKLRAEAFGRKIMRHDFVIPTEMDWNKTTIEPKLFINSRSTRIRIDGQINKLHGLSPRKMRLNATKAGQALKALWKMGKENVNREVIMHATYRFNRIDRQDVKDYVRWLPAWLTSYFIRTQWPYADKYQDSNGENVGPKFLVRLS